ncbi:unnamed protein product [Amoebophrya sp. A120]|nr:unnamed protein product [Amoebophrya sp. A120]|eukprot:GSA120T00018902001.1
MKFFSLTGLLLRWVAGLAGPHQLLFPDDRTQIFASAAKTVDEFRFKMGSLHMMGPDPTKQLVGDMAKSVVLVQGQRFYSRSHECTGVIVGPSLLLTSAYCVGVDTTALELNRDGRVLVSESASASGKKLSDNSRCEAEVRHGSSTSSSSVFGSPWQSVVQYISGSADGAQHRNNQSKHGKINTARGCTNSGTKHNPAHSRASSHRGSSPRRRNICSSRGPAKSLTIVAGSKLQVASKDDVSAFLWDTMLQREGELIQEPTLQAHRFDFSRGAVSDLVVFAAEDLVVLDLAKYNRRSTSDETTSSAKSSTDKKADINPTTVFTASRTTSPDGSPSQQGSSNRRDHDSTPLAGQFERQSSSASSTISAGPFVFGADSRVAVVSSSGRRSSASQELHVAIGMHFYYAAGRTNNHADLFYAQDDDESSSSDEMLSDASKQILLSPLGRSGNKLYGSGKQGGSAGGGTSTPNSMTIPENAGLLKMQELSVMVDEDEGEDRLVRGPGFGMRFSTTVGDDQTASASALQRLRRRCCACGRGSRTGFLWTTSDTSSREKQLPRICSQFATMHAESVGGEEEDAGGVSWDGTASNCNPDSNGRQHADQDKDCCTSDEWTLRTEESEQAARKKSMHENLGSAVFDLYWDEATERYKFALSGVRLLVPVENVNAGVGSTSSCGYYRSQMGTQQEYVDLRTTEWASAGLSAILGTNPSPVGTDSLAPSSLDGTPSGRCAFIGEGTTSRTTRPASLGSDISSAADQTEGCTQSSCDPVIANTLDSPESLYAEEDNDQDEQNKENTDGLLSPLMKALQALQVTPAGTPKIFGLRGEKKKAE